MPKPRKIPSIEQGIVEAFSLLKDIGIEEAVKKYSKKKSASFFRSCSDPETDHSIQHNDSIAIDKECLNINGSTPMLSAHEALIKKHQNENLDLNKKNLAEVINELELFIGEFQATLHKAKLPNSPGGSDLTIEEKIKINKSINNVENLLKDLKIQIDSD